MYVMELNDNGKWIVGFYRPDGTWVDAPDLRPDGQSNYNVLDAMETVNYLNGGNRR